jgi:hypothetical protein
VDSSAVSRTEVVVDPLFASRNEPARVHAEVGTRVEQELPFTITSVTKTLPVVLAQTSAVVDVRCVSFPAGGKRRAEYSFGRLYQQRVDAASSREEDLLPERRFLQPDRRFLELRRGSLKLSEGGPARR